MMPLRHAFTTLALVILEAGAILGAGTVNGETADLSIRFVYADDSFRTATFKADRDVAFCGRSPIVDERLIVEPDSRGIQNVVVYIDTRRGGTELAPQPPSNIEHVLTTESCRFAPHVIIARAGDSIRHRNPDEVGHNLNFSFFNNNQRSFTLPIGQTTAVELKQTEPAPIPIECNIHPWMKAYAVVLDHPFAAVSDRDGRLTIRGMPANQPLRFRVFHEAGRIAEVVVNDKQKTWERGRFTITPKPGANEFGVVTLPKFEDAKRP